jgi:hypothetical protein
MKKTAHLPKIQIKTLKPGELRMARSNSSLLAQRILTAQQAHRQMRRNGSVPSPNPFYDRLKKAANSFSLLNSGS